MFRLISFVLVGTLVAAGWSRSIEQPPESPKPASAPAVETPKPGDAEQNGQRSSGVAASGDTRRRAEQLQEKLPQDPAVLAKMAVDRGREAIADFKFGQPIARAEALVRKLEARHFELRKRADQLKLDRDSKRTGLNAKIETLRRQFADDTEECNRQLNSLLNSLAPELLDLKQELKRCNESLTKVGLQLANARLESIALVNARNKMAAQGQGRKEASLKNVGTVVEDEEGELTPKPRPASATTALPTRSIEERIKELDDK